MGFANTTKSSQSQDPGMRFFRISIIIIIILFVVFLIWQGRKFIRTPEPRTLVVYCYSGMQEVMENAIFPAFQNHWLKRSGEKLEYIPTFAGSGEITTRILQKFPAEVAILSSHVDAWHISGRGFTAKQWQQDLPHKGIISRTPIIMITREGNPRGIVHFLDLEKSGIGIIYPDPMTSGAGQWVILAVYGFMQHQYDDTSKAFQLLRSMSNNLVEQPRSAREAIQRFINDKGDVLITYEANVLGNPIRQQIPGELVCPQSTIMCEAVVLPIEKNIRAKQRELIDSFVHFLWSREAQEMFVRYGFHSVDDTLNAIRDDFGIIQDPFTLDSLRDYKDVKKIINEVMSIRSSSSREK